MLNDTDPRPLLVTPTTVEPAMRLCGHSHVRLTERTQLSAASILKLWREGRTVRLTGPRRHSQRRDYQLFWSTLDQAFFVGVLAQGVNVLVTVLTRPQFEASNWAIAHGALKRAAWLTLPEQDYPAWVAQFEAIEGPEPELGITPAKPDPQAGRSIRILLEYWDDQLTLNTLRLGNVPIVHAALLDDISQVSAQPWFWDWFAERLDKKGGEHVLARAEALYALRGGKLVELQLT